jgi:hypothetical protein
MALESDPDRQYTDREVRLILKTAVELQQRADQNIAPGGGMSLAELQQVAAEAGIDPELVRRAAARVDGAASPAERNAFLGSPTQIVLEQVVNKATDPAEFDKFLEVVRATTHEVGEVSTVGRQFGWKGRLDGAATAVAVSASEGRTTFRVTIALDEVALGHFMLKGMGVGVGGGFVGGTALSMLLGPLGFALGVGTLAAGYWWARNGFAHATQRYRVRARELIDALVKRV